MKKEKVRFFFAHIHFFLYLCSEIMNPARKGVTFYNYGK